MEPEEAVRQDRLALLGHVHHPHAAFPDLLQQLVAADPRPKDLNLSQFTAQSIIKMLCALGVGSLICLVAFLGLGAIYRKELDQGREECRRLATKLIETRLSKTNTPLRNLANDPG